MSSATLVSPAWHSAPESAYTLGPEVVDLVGLCSDDKGPFIMDPEQALVLDDIFAMCADGKSAAFEAAVIAPRQNLKTGVLKAAALGKVFVLEQRLVVWSAHEFFASREAFRDLRILIESCPDMDREVVRVLTGSGSESIEFSGDRRMIFKARSSGSGRSLSGDTVILDEAFALSADEVGALLPTLAARPDPQVLYGSTAGGASSKVLRQVRDRGRAGAPRVAYSEWAAQRRACETPGCTHWHGVAVGCVLDDEAAWLEANTAVARGRITLETVAGLRASLPPEQFARECLTWWVEDSEAGALSTARWAELADPDALRGTPVSFGLDVTGERDAWVAVAWRRPDGAAYVMLANAGLPMPAGRLAVEVARMSRDWSGRVASPKAFLSDLGDAGVDAVSVTSEEFTAASGVFADAVTSGTVRHGNQKALNDAVKSVKWRAAGTDGSKSFQLAGCPEVGPLAAATRALHILTDAESVYEARGLLTL